MTGTCIVSLSTRDTEWIKGLDKGLSVCLLFMWIWLCSGEPIYCSAELGIRLVNLARSCFCLVCVCVCVYILCVSHSLVMWRPKDTISKVSNTFWGWLLFIIYPHNAEPCSAFLHSRQHPATASSATKNIQSVSYCISGKQKHACTYLHRKHMYS